MTLRITYLVKFRSCFQVSLSATLIAKVSARDSPYQSSTSWSFSITKRSSGKITQPLKNSKKGNTTSSRICGSNRSSGRTVRITSGLKDWNFNLRATKDLNYGMSKAIQKSQLILMTWIIKLFEKLSFDTRIARAPSVCWSFMTRITRLFSNWGPRHMLNFKRFSSFRMAKFSQDSALVFSIWTRDLLVSKSELARSEFYSNLFQSIQY